MILDIARRRLIKSHRYTNRKGSRHVGTSRGRDPVKVKQWSRYHAHQILLKANTTYSSDGNKMTIGKGYPGETNWVHKMTIAKRKKWRCHH